MVGRTTEQARERVQGVVNDCEAVMLLKMKDASANKVSVSLVKVSV